MPLTSCPRVISPPTVTEDFARQLSYDDFLASAASAVLERPVVLCSALVDGSAVLRDELGETRSAALMRELVLLMRRNLRGTDAVASRGDELLILLNAPLSMAERVAHRLIGAARMHHFAGGSAEHALKLTLSMGLAAAPEHAIDVDALLAGARAAQAAAGGDASRIAFTPRASSLDLPRFVGRTEALARLTQLLEASIRGSARVVAVFGETGVGTTALVRAFEPEVRLTGGSLISAQCRENGLVPYALWRDVLRGVHRIGIKSTRLWRELPSFDVSLEHVSDGKTGVRSKVALLDELADYLCLAAQQRPLTIHLEELQWADGASWEALEYLIPRLESERVLFVLSFRVGGSDDDNFEPWSSLASRPRHSELRLTSLTRDDVKRWLEGSLRSGVVGRDLLAYVYRYTDGNPLMLTHLLRDMQERGQLTLGSDGWRAALDAELPIVRSLDVLLRRRILRLPAAARAVLDAAAVVGRECEKSFLTRVLSMDPAETSAALSHLLDVGLLTPTFERVRGAVVVTHETVAEAARSLLSEERRVDLHLRVARLLAEDVAISPIEIAAHFDRAEQRGDAHAYAIRGAEEALKVYENGAAATLLSLAERTAPSERAIADVRVRMASLAELAGRYEEAEGLCDLAIDWYESQGDLLGALDVILTRAMVRMRRGRSARETLDDLLTIDSRARQEGVGAERASILLIIAQTHWRLGDLHAARSVAEECLAIAEQGSDPVLLIDACNRLAVTIQLEEPAHARELLRRALVLSDDLGDYVRRVRTLHNLGVLEVLVNNWDEARVVLHTAAEEARTAGLAELWGRATLNSGVLAARVGDYERAAQVLSEALRVCAAAQNSELQLYATYNLAHVERDRGRMREAGETYELVMALAERIGQAEVQEGACAGFGLCRLEAGNAGEARQAAARVEPFLAMRTDWFQGRELGEALIIRLALLDDKPEEATHQFLRAVTLADPTDVFAAAWLTAEFGASLRPSAPEMVHEVLERYANRPEVSGNPGMRARFDVLISDSRDTIDR